MPDITRRTMIAMSLATVAFAVVGCTANSTARSLTDDEANRLAGFRFMNYRAGEVSYDFASPESIGATGALTVHTEQHNGFGLVGSDDAPAGYFVWGSHSIFECVSPQAVADAAAWTGRDLAQQPFDLFLLMALMMSLDRPDNPQLLQQSSARHLGQETVDGVVCDIFSGPGAEGVGETSAPGDTNVTYSIDQGGMLRKFKARLDPSGDQWWTLTYRESAPVDPIPDQVWSALREAEADRGERDGVAP